MKFALCNELFEGWNVDGKFDFPRVFEYVKRCGYDGVEIAPFTLGNDISALTPARRGEIRREAEKAGLEITGLHWLLARTEGFYLTSPDDAVRRRTAEHFRQLIRLCADLGGEFMVLGSPQQRNLLPGVTTDAALDYTADVLGTVVPLLEAVNVRIAVEPLARKETDFLRNAAETIELLRRIGAPGQIALHLDCKAMSDEETPIPELIRKHRDRLIYFHANDPNLRGPGFGVLDFKPILAALCEVDYGGWVSVEVFDYSPGIETLAEKSLEYLKNCKP